MCPPPFEHLEAKTLHMLNSISCYNYRGERRTAAGFAFATIRTSDNVAALCNIYTVRINDGKKYI